ncbi:MAG: thiamine pyrophosphate-dependent enzyme [Verrucomicrobiota bacterium]|nr:thiamine pyrophosphate-dependent enzyme [Verrucomicrobiota bacterium]
MKTDPRFSRDAGCEVFTGNELLVKGCLETEGGTHLWTGYPGSPVSAFFDVARGLRGLLKEHGIHAAIANNEALGAAMVNGSQMHGLRAITVQKSVGAHVASDALALGNLVGAHPEGGAVIVLGDDPWSDSTQVAADSRFLCKHLMMPVLEPSDAQELKDWIDLAFKLSRESELYIGYLVTTNQADGGGSVQARTNHFPDTNSRNPFGLDTSAIDLERNVLLPPRTWRKEQELPERFERLWASARRHGANRILRPASPMGRGLGFVTSAAAYSYLRHALAVLGLDLCFPIMKMGVTYPLDAAMVREFSEGLTDLIVIEERRSFLEDQVTTILNRARQDAEEPARAVNVWGKQFPHGLAGIPETRGLNPSKLIERLGQLFLKLPELDGTIDAKRVNAELNLLEQVEAVEVQVIDRTPTFCPGCPHRDSASVLVEVKKQFSDPSYMKRQHGQDPVDLVFHGDTGCYTMLMFEPTKDLMHNYSGMGLGGGTGAGIDPFIRNKQVVFMGDSTFFHSGQSAISNSIKNGQDITYVILDNKTTAMTGHQETPGTETNLLGEPTFSQNIETIIEAMTGSADTGATVVRVNPEDRENYRDLLEKTILQNGVKILLADKECGITYHRRLANDERAVEKAKGYLPEKQFINITPEVCENCLECTRATGCPGLTLEQTPYGQKVQIDKTWCVNDGACTRSLVAPDPAEPQVKACPSFGEVRVTREQAPPAAIDRLDFSRLPEPNASRVNGLWHGYLAGVGGMGIGITTAILVRAGHRDGYQVKFCDKKGLAIRNGGVYSMITFSGPEAHFTSNLIPYGKADLILGIDLLEAARAIDPQTNQRVGSRRHTTVVANTHLTPTIKTLLGQTQSDPGQLEADLRKHSRANLYHGSDASVISERIFGSQRYVNTMMLGLAFQLGRLPLSFASIEWAVRASLGGAAEANLQAFQLGRLLAYDSTAVLEVARLPVEPKDYADVLRDKEGIITRTPGRGPKVGLAYRHMLENASEHLQVEGPVLADFARRVYDLIQFENEAYAKEYIEQILELHEMDLEQENFRATRALIWNLHRVMAIKDEVYVAHLLTSEEKLRRDRARYDVDPERGDQIHYRHLNRPEFKIFGIRLAWNMKTRNWMLRIMRRMRWLRRALPQWHAKEKDFREWYRQTAQEAAFYLNQPGAYSKVVDLLELPEAVTGYREVRYPKMDEACRQASVAMAALKATQESDVYEINSPSKIRPTE